MAVMYAVNDIDAARAAASQLQKAEDSINAIVSNVKACSESIGAFDKTVGLEVQCQKYVADMTAQLAKLGPLLSQAGTTLAGIVTNAEQMQQMQSENALGHV